MIDFTDREALASILENEEARGNLSSRDWQEIANVLRGAKRKRGRPAGSNASLKKRAHVVALEYLDCIMKGLSHDQALETLAKDKPLGKEAIAKDVKVSRKGAILLDEYEHSKNLQKRHPQWEAWRAELDKWHREQQAQLADRLQNVMEEYEK